MGLLQATTRHLMQVFDGHSGEAAARFAEEHLLSNLLREESFLTAPAEALVRQCCAMPCVPAGILLHEVIQPQQAQPWQPLQS